MPRRVAVKILHPQHAENPTVRARFRRELEAVCRVSHENVVAVYDIGEDPNLGLYYVMELVRGTPLKDYLNGDPLPWAFVYRVATQLTRALHAIHSAGIVHRDLKPQNIMLVERSSLDELVKVLDFGIASLKTPEEEKRDIELTGARMVLGTPPYMSPEQTYMRADRERLGVDVDARSDIYSMGVILYEMAAGRRPFSGDSHDIVVAHRLTKPMPLERMVGVMVPREFADLVMSCLAKDPKDRPQSAKEFLAALKECELKPIRRWGEGEAAPQPSDQRDLATLADALALPIEAVPADTQPRLVLGATAPRTRSLWAPLGALAVGALVAMVAFAAARPTAPPQTIPVEAVAAGGPPTKAADGSRTPDSKDTARPEAPATPRDGAATTQEAGAAATAAAARDADAAAEAQKAAEDARQAALNKVVLVVTTQPPGAQVIVAGQVEGVTPVNLSFDVRESRQLELLFKKDRFEDLPVVLSIGPELGGQHLVVHQALERKKGVGRDPFKDL